ncbi:MAG: hypothetical protein K0Q68_1961 [Moraxellaceae bacterium]|jgi:tetratricopeptide (TPR) repeat protein|nr:hypothetical protein [Moraxellaceae bacterium]
MNSSRIAVTPAGVAMAMVLMLTGCAGPNSRPQQSMPAASPTLSPQVIAEFESAMKFLAEENHEKAIELLERVASVSRNNPVPYINLAMVHAKTGNLEKAEHHFKQALAMEPENPVAINEYALLLRRSGRFAEARSLYEGILKKHPNYALAQRNLGVLCDLYLRDYACALRGYEAWSAANPDDKAARIWVADMQKRTGSEGRP